MWRGLTSLVQTLFCYSYRHMFCYLARMRITKFLAPLILFCACNTVIQKENSQKTSKDSTHVVILNNIIYQTRNTDITPSNSYSDLFLDSIAIARFINLKKLSADDENNLRSFYNYRNLQFAWFTSLGFTEQAKGFWNLQDKFETKADKELQRKMDTLLNMDTVSISRFDTAFQNIELGLTNAYLQFFKSNREKTQFVSISPEKAIPVKKQNTLLLADSILLQPVDSSPNKSSYQYYLLRQRLQFYDSIAKQGGWQPILITGKHFKKDSQNPVIGLIKNRLKKSGNTRFSDSSNVYDDSLVMAIKNYQLHNGIKPTGNITDTLIRSLNIPVNKRIEQIIINLNRMQWMPVMQNDNYISVNIPDLMLNVYENKVKVFDMPVVIGKEGTNTSMFTGDLDKMVFSPYWNIPTSIVQREILPKMQSDPGYLKSRNMEITGKNDSLPVIRQLPGKDNALGKVKFLFPNRYDIYFHDTNAKDIFSKDNRAVSHGCIRLADAEKLAVYLLRNNQAWSPKKIHIAMNAAKEQAVDVDPAMPVTICYYTAWVDETGQLNFCDDVYANDKKIAPMMFENYVQSASTNGNDSSLNRQ